MNKKLKIAIIGASGYTGLELIRILQNHQFADIQILIANSNAGKNLSEIYPHLDIIDLPKLITVQEADFSDIDVVFSCLPHNHSQKIIADIFNSKHKESLRIIDLAADFRLKNTDDYKKWYGQHQAINLQKEAIYSLPEINREKIKKARLIACPGCYPTSILLPLLPLLNSCLIKPDNIISDSKSGVTGAGRSLKIGNLFCEANENISAYAIGSHRHIAEIEQEINLISKSNSQIDFTPHLIPVNRGILSTIYVDLEDGFEHQDLINCLTTKYEDEYFVKISDHIPSIKEVNGTNLCKIAIIKARSKNKAIIISVIDNLIKGASGQAVQNMNIAFDIDEREGLEILGQLT
ncbi:N-acetyl-gamma-glutamyl-phosphate reductase [Rickettsiales bacterium]|nr:N-acetyl-gamma-glutamyl-phosphate reductase [Rickettsiales bacterium]MDB2550349.1 N-acetyl-gamma-glutamyl-phosphate reductase [Rickettsiales bacterium]